jgi:hypothetical protein
MKVMFGLNSVVFAVNDVVTSMVLSSESTHDVPETYWNMFSTFDLARPGAKEATLR